MDNLQLMGDRSREIKASWLTATLMGQQGYITELEALEVAVGQIYSVQATKLHHDIRYLREQIEEKILPAQQKRTIDLWRGSTRPPESTR